MGNIGVFVNGNQIGTVTSVNLPLDSLESPNFKKAGNPNEYEYYMRRGDRMFLRNEYGKLSIEATKLKESIDGIKYGTKLIVDARW